MIQMKMSHQCIYSRVFFDDETFEWYNKDDTDFWRIIAS